MLRPVLIFPRGKNHLQGESGAMMIPSCHVHDSRSIPVLNPACGTTLKWDLGYGIRIIKNLLQQLQHQDVAHVSLHFLVTKSCQSKRKTRTSAKKFLNHVLAQSAECTQNGSSSPSHESPTFHSSTIAAGKSFKNLDGCCMISPL